MGSRKIFCNILVKPYCYRWAVNHFQIPGEAEGCVSLRKNRMLNAVFRNLLRRKTSLTEEECESSRWRTSCLSIEIGSHNLENFGLDLPARAKSEMATLMEQMCIDDFKSFFVQMYMVEPRKKNIIELYHQMRGFTEQDWPQESMQKIVTRMHITSAMRRTRFEWLQQFNQLITTQVSEHSDSKLRELCNLISTTVEASVVSMPSRSGTFSESGTTGHSAQ